MNGISSLTKENYLCPTEVDYVQPLRALNSHGEWRIIVNQVRTTAANFNFNYVPLGVLPASIPYFSVFASNSGRNLTYDILIVTQTRYHVTKTFKFFKNWPALSSVSFIFGLFKQTIHFLQQINVKKSSPSSIWCWNSNPRPLKHELSPRPKPLVIISCNCSAMTMD